MNFRFAPIVTLTLVGLVPLSQAQIVLKPRNGEALPLRMKELDSYTLIKNGVAATTMQLTFANEANARIEADFLYTLKPGSLVTNFAYWYGQEKVIARVAEKERAKRIYEYITSRMRDPALIEMIGKRSFRARIFPIMPNSDLKVEMQFAQALNGGAFVLPLVSQEAQTFDKLRVKIDAERSSQTVDVIENIGLEKVQNNNTTTIELKGENYRPTKDLRVTVVNAPAKVQGDLFAAKSGGNLGFFTLNLTPSSSVKKPTVAFSGVKVTDVWPKRFGPVKAGQSILVTGRYSGSGKAKAVVRDGGKLIGQTEVVFEDKSEANNAASKLWACMKIEGLGNSARNRKEVVNLSQRFTIPSTHTSWIAIPEEERIRYKQEKAMADIAVIIPKFTRAVRKYGVKSRQAKAVMNEIQTIAKQNDVPADSFFRDALYDETYRVSAELAERLAKGKSVGDLERRMADLATVPGIEPYENLRSHLYSHLNNMSLEILKKEVKGENASSLRSRLGKLAARTKQDPANLIRNASGQLTFNKAQQLVALEKRDPKAAELDDLKKEIDQLETLGGVPKGSSYKNALRQADQNEYYNLSNELTSLVSSGDVESGRFQQTRTRFEALSKRIGTDGYAQMKQNLTWRMYDRLRDYSATIQKDGVQSDNAKAKLAYFDKVAKAFKMETSEITLPYLKQAESNWMGQLKMERNQTIRDMGKIREMEKTMDRLLEATGTSRADLEQRDNAWGWTPNQELRDRLVFLLRDPKKNAQEIAKLKAQLKKADEEYRGKEWAESRIERLSVETQIDHLQNQTRTPEQQRILDDLWKQQKELRARMGDPLLHVEAPKDAREVVAIFPNGEIKALEFNAAIAKWECRFDIPTYALEGSYQVLVHILDAQGVRSSQTFNYSVDVTAPAAVVKAIRVDSKVRVEVEGSEDLARVEIAFGDARPISLRKTAPGRFYGLIDADAKEAIAILTDKAHNRTEIKVTVR